VQNVGSKYRTCKDIFILNVSKRTANNSDILCFSFDSTFNKVSCLCQYKLLSTGVTGSFSQCPTTKNIYHICVVNSPPINAHKNKQINKT